MNRIINPFFSPPGKAPMFERERGYLYAAYEVTAPPEEAASGQGRREPERVFFECVVAEDDGYRAAYEARSGTDKKQLAILELSGHKLPRVPEGVEPGDVLWYRFYFSKAPSGEEDGLLYLSLFSEAVLVRVELAGGGPIAVNAVPAGVDVPQVTGIPMVRPVKMRLRLQLEDLDTTGGVIAYDVGQGACHAAMNAMHRPSLYIDFGGGVLGSTHTFPSEFKGFCVSHRATIILTHWDWDHWSSALRQPSALEAQWIAPELSKRLPIQTAFATELARRGNLHTWVASTGPSLRSRSLTIEKCTGKTSNDSGLAVTVKLPGTRKRFLVPGDATYEFIPSASSSSGFDGLSMTHHGGVLYGKSYPKPKRRAAAIIHFCRGDEFP